MKFAFVQGPHVSAATAVTIAESASGPDGRVVWETEIETDEVFLWWLPDGSRILGYMPVRRDN